MSRKRFTDVFNGIPRSRPPFWFMRQAGRYLPEYLALRRQQPDFLKFCYTPELVTEAALQPLRRFDPDAAILFSDILVVPDALGADVAFLEGEGPRLTPVRTRHQVLALDRARFEDYLAPVLQAVGDLSRELPDDKALIGFAGAPWTLAVYMVEGRGGTDGPSIRRWAALDSDGGFARLIDVLSDAIAWFLAAQVDAGAQAVQLFDSWAGILGETGFRRWVIEPTRRIVAEFKARHPGIPIIGFPRAAGVLYQEYVDRTGVDGVSLDAGVPTTWAAESLKPRAVLQGNLDNQVLVVGGQPMETEVQRILRTLGPDRFVFNLGHGILPDTPPAHVEAVADLIKAWSGR